MKFAVLASLAAVAAAAPSVESRATWTEWFANIHAQPEPFNPNNLTFAFDFAYTDGTTYKCSTYYDLDTGVSANTSCAAGVTATVGFPSGLVTIQNWAPYVYNDYVQKTYTANISTENPNYLCGHSGTPGVAATCFNQFGTFTATVI